MDTNQLKGKVLAALFEIAPEAEGEPLNHSRSIRDQLDIDSVDYLNFMIRLHEMFQVEIPETDYPQLGTIDQIVGYLSEKV
jgi:acyl carrier protein